MRRNVFGAVIAVMVLVAVTSCGTTKTAEQKTAERRLEMMQDSVAHIHALQALKECHFVIMADRIALGNMGAIYNSPRKETNFVYALGDEGVIQIAFDNGHLGLNGLGGVTCKGNVRNAKIRTDKKGNVCMEYTLIGFNVNANVMITLYKGTDDAQAYVTTNHMNGNMTVYGKVVPYSGK